MTEENKKKEAQGVEKRAISKITNVGEAPLSGCRIQEKIDWKGVTFALVLLATIDVSLKRLSGKKEGNLLPRYLQCYTNREVIEVSCKIFSESLDTNIRQICFSNIMH